MRREKFLTLIAVNELFPECKKLFEDLLTLKTDTDLDSITLNVNVLIVPLKTQIGRL